MKKNARLPIRAIVVGGSDHVFNHITHSYPNVKVYPKGTDPNRDAVRSADVIFIVGPNCKHKQIHAVNAAIGGRSIPTVMLETKSVYAIADELAAYAAAYRVAG